jgi:hypothetical protein
MIGGEHLTEKKLYDLLFLSIINPAAYEEKYNCWARYSERTGIPYINNIMEEIDKFNARLAVRMIELVRISSGDYHLRNLDLFRYGFTIRALLEQENTGAISPFRSLERAMLGATSFDDTSFGAQYGMASHMLKNFMEIRDDLHRLCEIDLNLDDTNIVYQLISLVELYKNNPNHPINQCIQDRVLVPC